MIHLTIQALANIIQNAPNLAPTDQWTLRRLYLIITISKGNDLFTIKSYSSFRFPTSHKLLIIPQQKNRASDGTFCHRKAFYHISSLNRVVAVGMSEFLGFSVQRRITHG
jgi:hypothetical protein